MPKRNPGMTPEEQKQAFRREAQRRIDAGELDADAADAALDALVRKSIKQHGA